MHTSRGLGIIVVVVTKVKVITDPKKSIRNIEISIKKNHLQPMVLAAEEQLIEIQQYFQPANSLFASKENSKEFSGVQVVDIQQKLHKHIVDISGNTRLVAHGQPCPFSAKHET